MVAARAAVALPEWRDAAASAPDETVWREGYVYARLGRHDLAWQRWRTITEPALAARVQASRAASMRQMGLHDRAEVEDLAGLDAAGRSEVAASDVAALAIGLVADAVGAGVMDLTGARFDQAGRLVAALDRSVASDRQRIRLGWATVEVALLTDDRHLAVGAPLPTVTARGGVDTPAVYRAGSAHHLAKGLLFAGVLHQDLRYLDAALRHAPSGLRWAVHAARADLGAPDAAEAAARERRLVRVPRHLARHVR